MTDGVMPRSHRDKVRPMRSLALALVVGLTACTPAAPPEAPSAYEGKPVLNPKLSDGRLVYRSFGDHHPECFAFASDDSRDTETVACPDGALRDLESCPAGRLHLGEGECICVPLDGEPTRAACP